MDKFKAFRIYQEKNFHARIETLTIDDLTEGDVLVEVEYSSVNYKDALAGSGRMQILRKSPLNGGIDLAGTVIESNCDEYAVGDAVLAHGSGLSETIDGGYARYARLPASCIVPRAESMSAFEAMAIGTAGFTAALCIEAMEKNDQSPDLGEILVTGATGGVGSFAINLLSQSGYQTVAATRKIDVRDYLKSLGATRVIDSVELVTGVLGKRLWGGAIDNLGGNTLATILKTTRDYGNVASVGLVQSAQLMSSVMPFIIRGINLLGVSSANCPQDKRKKIWERLATDMKPTCLDKVIAKVISLDELPIYFDKLLKGEVCGRIIVNLKSGAL